MRKKPVIFVLIGVLFFTWVTVRLTHTFEYYTLQSGSNSPTLPQGAIVFASWLKKPDHGNFVCYQLPGQKAPWISRVIGKGGDVIEIKNAAVYRNGKLLDEPFTNSDYTITRAQLNRIAAYVVQNKYHIDTLADSTYRISITRKELLSLQLNLPPVIAEKGEKSDGIFPDFKSAGYNQDNFGPVKVPADSYFLMGDNRHDALDSRYKGFIRKDWIVATVLNH